MLVIPAIDLMDSSVVRLFKGDYNQKKVYSKNPIEVVEGFARSGATHLHVVDLDGAKEGSTTNFSIISRIVQTTKLITQVGGGIRSLDAIANYLDLGVRRVILGTKAITDFSFLDAAITKFGPESIVLGVDVWGESVRTHGWEKDSGNLYEVLDKAASLGVKTVLCTDIQKDGTLEGSSIPLYKTILAKYKFDLIASGGVANLEDIQALEATGIYACVSGKALLEGKLDLQSALGRK